MSLHPDIIEYIEDLPEDRKIALTRLAKIIEENIPSGFESCMSYNMPGWVVPQHIYPSGYHCNPKLPLPFLNLASQKRHISLYHMGIYANQELLDWFVEEYPKHCKTKLNMGKSCIRFSNPKKIPFALIKELVSKMTVEDWIQVYENGLKK